MRKRIEKDDIRRSESTRKFSDRSTGPSSENRGRGDSRSSAPRSPRSSSSQEGQGSSGPQREFNSNRPRTPYAGDRNQDRERKPYAGDRNESDRPRTPYAGDRNQDRDRKPFAGDRNSSDRPRTPYAGDLNQDRERKPYAGDRNSSDRPRTPYAGDRNQDRERKPYAGDRNASDRPGTPYAGDRNQDRERKPYAGDRNASDRPRTPYAGDRNQDRERKPYAGDRNFEDRPKRNYTSKRSDETQISREQQDNGAEPRSYQPLYKSDTNTKDRSLESNQEFRPKRAFEGPKRNFSGDRKPSTGDRASYNRDEKNDRPKRSFDTPREENSESREAFQGKFSKRDTFKSRNRFEERPSFTPQYKLDRFKENAPAKIQKKIREVDGRSDDLVRLNRYIANAGICSRRDADKLIAAGEIKVNNKVVIEMGYQVAPTDIVKYGNRKLNREKPAYVLLNKPKDFLTTTEDPNDRKTVMELVKNAGDARIYPVGRLDRNTTGLLLLTNDGELADRLTHPSHEIEKIYQAELDKPLTDEDFEKIKAGLILEDGEIKVDDIAKVTPDGYVIGVKIHSGKNRIVRRIFEHLGYDVTKLDRTTFAGLTKKDLPRGHWRYLTERELVKLKYFM
jgi:23S rRNA pseudouridine2605 synthase